MAIAASEFEIMRAWLAHLLAEITPLPASLRLEAHPIAVLDAMVSKSPVNARKGLSMAIGDWVEMTAGLPAESVALADQSFAANGLPTLSAMRARFSKRIRSVLKRGRIRDELEYYEARNAAAALGSSAEGEQLARLADEYEESLRLTARSPQ